MTEQHPAALRRIIFVGISLTPQLSVVTNAFEDRDSCEKWVAHMNGYPGFKYTVMETPLYPARAATVEIKLLDAHTPSGPASVRIVE